MNKKLLITIAVIGIIVVASYTLLRDTPQNLSATETQGAEIDYASDVIGTRVGTTTTGQLFHGDHSVASTTAIVRAGGAEKALFTLKATAASSTPTGSVNLSFLGSNDWDCATSTSAEGTDGANDVSIHDINWYDIGDHIAELAGSQSITGTSTLVWSAVNAGQATDITLVNLNYQCIKVEVSASSTSLLIQSRLR